jgi:RNA polymerase sigma-70 factor (ECF subfamily)
MIPSRMIPSPTTRPSLLLRLRDRQDHEAWLQFVTLYEPVAYRLLRRHGLQDADAREVMQDFFLAVSRSIDRWGASRERGSFRGWLRRVIRNLVINWLQQQRRRPAAAGGSDFQAMLDLVPEKTDPDSIEFDLELRRAQFRRAAARIKQEVQPATWQAFWQTAVLGASAADAARQLGLEAGAVRVAKCRVLARLRTAVEELERAS